MPPMPPAYGALPPPPPPPRNELKDINQYAQKTRYHFTLLTFTLQHHPLPLLMDLAPRWCHQPVLWCLVLCQRLSKHQLPQLLQRLQTAWPLWWFPSSNNLRNLDTHRTFSRAPIRSLFQCPPTLAWRRSSPPELKDTTHAQIKNRFLLYCT